jgi:hypothetical protein
MQPLAKEKRHPADYRAELEHAQVAAVLSELPEDHAARAAYLSGAREASDSIQLSHFVADRRDLVERLVAAYLAHSKGIWSGYYGGSNS